MPNRPGSLVLFFACFSLIQACAPAYVKYISSYENTGISKEPDYSQPDCWAALPGKKSTADSIPFPLQGETIRDSLVDVFFIYPTTFTDMEDSAWNAGIDDAALNAKTDYSSILYQASAFNECRVYAPRYRQANLRAYYTKDTLRGKQALDFAYQDVRNAFLYYLAHFNQGRPVILASHSQGSTHAQRLLKEFFEDGPLHSKLVVAYVIGMDIPKTYFFKLGPCRDSLQTGCIVGWRSFRAGYEPDYITNEKGSSLVTNPLTWQTDEQYAPRTLNRGTLLRNFNKLAWQATDAQIHDGILWIHKPKIPGGFFLWMKNYHIADINLFYVNIRMNMRKRIAMYWKH